MLCRHCYADIGILGQKYHVCDAKQYMQRPSKKAQENERFVQEHGSKQPKQSRNSVDEYCSKCGYSHVDPCS